MAVVFEGFSIREYALRMRSVDVVKCWPFSGDGADDEISDKQNIQTFLPPMTVTKFRWWSHELDVIRSTQDEVTVQQNAAPQHQIRGNDDAANFVSEEVTEAQANAANLSSGSYQVVHHEDSKEERRKMKLAKGKLKTPKKRSIVEIFAEAQQIEKVDFESKQDKTNCRNVELKNSKIEKKKAKKMKKSMIVNKLMKKNTKKFKKNGQTMNKETTMLKLRNSVRFPKKLNDTSHNNFAKDGIDSAVIRKKKQDPNGLSTQKKHKVAQTSKSIAKHLIPMVIPVRGILKNHAKDVTEKNATICSLRGDSQANTSGIQLPKRQVRFSDMDDILGQQNVFSFGKNILNSYNDNLASSSQMDHSNGNKNDLATMNVNGVNADKVSFGNRRPLHLLPHSDDIVLQNLPGPGVTSQEKLKNSSCKNNLYTSDHLDRIHAETSVYGANPGSFSTRNEVCTPNVNPQICARVSGTSNSSPLLVDYFEDHSYEVLSSVANRRDYWHPSSSSIAMNEITNARLPALSQPAATNLSGHALQYHSASHMPSMEYMGSLFPFPAREHFMHDEYVCLPLNSQGELIRTSASGKVTLNQLNKSNFTAASSSQMGASSSTRERHLIEKTLPNNQLNLFSTENYLKDIPKVHLPAQLGVSELPAAAKDGVPQLMSGNVSAVGLLGSEQNSKYIPSSGLRQCYIQQEENSDLMLLNDTQLTMRLMGKDVSIIRSSKEMQRDYDGKVMAECSTSHASENSSFKRHCQSDWIFNPIMGNSGQPLENQALNSNIRMEVPDSRFFQPYQNSGSRAVFQDNWPSVSKNPGLRMNDIAYPSSYSTIINTAANLQDTFISEPEAIKISSQPPFVAAPHNNFFHIGSNPAESRCNAAQAAKSAFNFPFLHPDYCSEQLVRPSWPNSGSNSLFPWLFHPTLADAPTGPSQPFINVNGNYQMNQSRENLLRSPFHSPLSHPYKQVEHSLVPASVVHHSFVPAGSRNRASSIRMCNRERNKASDKLQSNSFSIGDPDVFMKAKKRSAAEENYSTRVKKVPKLGIQEGLGAVTELTRENFGKHIQFQVRASECAHRAFASSSKCICAGHQQNDLPIDLDLSDNVEASDVAYHSHDVIQNFDVGKSHVTIDALKVDKSARSSGPVKLSAGAKHILKPIQNIEQDNSKLTHSAIPFAALNDSSSLLESQKKSTKVYML